MRFFPLGLSLSLSLLLTKHALAEPKEVSPPASAPAEPGGLTDIEQLPLEDLLVTTGGRTESKLSESPSSVYVIDRKTIETSAAVTLADLLRQVPGLWVDNVTSGQSEILIRQTNGAPSNQLLVLIDGRSVLQDFYGLVNTMALGVNLLDLERIEVILGPSSTLYGSNAYSGVINLITRRAVDSGYRVQAQGLGGASWGGAADQSKLEPLKPLGGGFAEYTQRYGGVGLRLSAGGEYLPELTSRPPIPPNATSFVPDKHIAGNADVDWSGGNWKLRGQLSGSTSEGSFTAFSRAQLDATDLALTLHADKAHLVLDGDSLSLMLWGRYLTAGYGFTIDPLPTIPVNLGQFSTEFLGQYTTPRFYFNRLIVGVQTRVVDLDWNIVLPEGRVEQIYGLFAEDEFRPWQQTILTAGIRVETRETEAYKPLSHLTASPRVAFVYLPASGHSLRLEYSTAYRDPNPLEAFANAFVYAGAVRVLNPNPDVKPEQRQQGSFSYQGRFGWLRSRLEAFYAVNTDSIGLNAQTPASDLPQIWSNGGTRSFFGGSLRLDATPIPQLTLFAMYTYTGVYDFNSRAYLSSQPKDVVGIGGRLELGAFTASLQAYERDGFMDSNVVTGLPVQLKSSVTINARVAYALGARRMFEVFVAATNLADIWFGPGIRADDGDVGAEHEGPRLFAGLNFLLDAALSKSGGIAK